MGSCATHRAGTTWNCCPLSWNNMGRGEQGSQSGVCWRGQSACRTCHRRCHPLHLWGCTARGTVGRPTGFPSGRTWGSHSHVHMCTQIHLHTLTFSSPLKKINRMSVVHILNWYPGGFSDQKCLNQKTSCFPCSQKLRRIHIQTMTNTSFKQTVTPRAEGIGPAQVVRMAACS